MEMTMMTQPDRRPEGRAKIAALRRECQALDETVRAMEAHPSADDLQIVRVKKRRQVLRDQLQQLESQTRAGGIG
jgi:hypothetical protein